MIDFPPELKDHLTKGSEDYIDLLFAMAVAEEGKKGEAKRALQKDAGITPKTAERWFDSFTRVLIEDWLRKAVPEPPVTAAAAGNDLDFFYDYKARLLTAKFDDLRRQLDDALVEENEEREHHLVRQLRKLNPVMLRHYGLYPKTAFPQYFAK